MATSYATYDQYVTSTGDDKTAQARVEATLEELSAELRAECGIAEGAALSGDAAVLARRLVCDAARKGLVPPAIEGFEGSMSGATQASFTANGFTESVSMPSTWGSSWFDSRGLARLKRLVGGRQRIGTVSFAIGGQ